MWQYGNVRKFHHMHVSYGIHTLTTWIGHEEGSIQIQTYSLKIRCKTEWKKHFKSKQQTFFISFSIVTTLLILQEFSNPLSAPILTQHVIPSYYSNC